MTGDLDFGDVRNYPPENYHGIVVLRLPGDATARDIVGLLEEFVPQTGFLNGWTDDWPSCNPDA